MPNDKYKQRWDIFIALLLIITAIYVPLRVSFYDGLNYTTLVCDTIFNLFFMFDITLTFFTAIQKRGGLLETRHKYIAREYFKAWFWIDLTCCLPVEIFEILPM